MSIARRPFFVLVGGLTVVQGALSLMLGRVPVAFVVLWVLHAIAQYVIWRVR